MTELTLLVSRASGATYFDVLNKYTDEVIPLVNYLIESADEKENTQNFVQERKEGANQKDDFWNYV